MRKKVRMQTSPDEPQPVETHLSVNRIVLASPPMSSLSKRRLLSFADIMSARGLPSKMLSMVTSVNAELAGASFFAA